MVTVMTMITMMTTFVMIETLDTAEINLRMSCMLTNSDKRLALLPVTLRTHSHYGHSPDNQPQHIMYLADCRHPLITLVHTELPSIYVISVGMFQIANGPTSSTTEKVLRPIDIRFKFPRVSTCEEQNIFSIVIIFSAPFVFSLAFLSFYSLAQNSTCTTLRLRVFPLNVSCK